MWRLLRSMSTCLVVFGMALSPPTGGAWIDVLLFWHWIQKQQNVFFTQTTQSDSNQISFESDYWYEQSGQWYFIRLCSRFGSAPCKSLEYEWLSNPTFSSRVFLSDDAGVRWHKKSSHEHPTQIRFAVEHVSSSFFEILDPPLLTGCRQFTAFFLPKIRHFFKNVSKCHLESHGFESL